MAKEAAQDKLMKLMQKKQAAPTVVVPKKETKKFSVSMQNINQFLFLLLVVGIAALVLEIRSGYSLINTPVTFDEAQVKNDENKEIVLPSAKPLNVYSQEIQTRNIFKPYEQAAKPAGDLGLAKRLSKYKLVGVAWLDLPETASIMIEDSQTKAMYFLKQGEQLDGVTVKTIYTDRAVFSYENEETTIKL